jgi:hypothetical protein
MSSISYIRAGVSCLPIIGPLVALYNVLEVRNELSNDPLLDSLTQLKLSMIQMVGGLSAFTGRKEGVDKARQDLETEKNKIQDRFISPTQKGRFYALCGVVGNVLSAITAVALAAIGIVAKGEAIFWGISFTVHAILHGYLCYQHNKNLNALQNLQRA